MDPVPATAQDPKLQKKRARTSTACEGCRKKRAKCGGEKPSCRACLSSGTACVYDLAGDKRKPFTKDVVTAMQLRIDSLETELAQMHLERGTTLPTDIQFYGGPALASRNLPPDVLQGGLALNTHGELRFYGPTSSFRSVLADSSKLAVSSVAAARAHSLTRAPLPGDATAEPVVPRRPPDLTLEFRTHLLRLAFEYTLSSFGLVSERQFYHDLALNPLSRTTEYSPFLLNIVLGIGSRYLDPKGDWPREICADPNDVTTRGDVFIAYARCQIDLEWRHPNLSTVRALCLLAIYSAGSGLDGPCWMFAGSAMRLSEDLGLHLGIHRLSMGSGGISDALIVARRNTFFAAFQTDVILSTYIGRRATFSTDDIDQMVPPVDNEIEFDVPMYRSSAFHAASKLILIASKMMSQVYALRPNISLQSRQVAVPGLHLELEQWYHDLPGPLRASTTIASKAPHPFVIGLNLLYHTVMIQLHRPFFRRVASDSSISVSTEKCLSSAKHVVRLVKLQKNSHGLSYVAPMFQHACFCCGTILALSAVEDGISGAHEKDSERRSQAQNDLRSICSALREVGDTWRTAHTSADVLEALMSQWNAATATSGATSGTATGTATPTTGDGTTFDPTAAFWPMQDSFPFLFPSWDLNPEGATPFDDFMSLLNPVDSTTTSTNDPLSGPSLFDNSTSAAQEAFGLAGVFT